MTGRTRRYPFNADDAPVLDPIYRMLRRDEPISRIQLPYGDEAWLVTRYEDVRFVLCDRRFSRSAAAGETVPRMLPDLPDSSSLLSMDGVDHLRLRKLISKAFTIRQIERIRPRIRQHVDALLTGMADREPPVDLVAGLTLALPILVICEVLGVQDAHQDRFLVWSEALLSVAPDGKVPASVAEQHLAAYLAELIEGYRRRPAKNILSELVAARDERDQLTEDELVTMGFTLLVAGYETTANQLGNSVYTLFCWPDCLRQLRENPALVPDAVEELLRFLPPGLGPAAPRIATEDVTVGGTVVHAGEPVMVVTGSANHDETVFADPERLDLTRRPNPHLAFGHGAHHCPGAALARVELQEALRGLLDKFPTLAPAPPPAKIRWRRRMAVRGPQMLPVVW